MNGNLKQFQDFLEQNKRALCSSQVSWTDVKTCIKDIFLFLNKGEFAHLMLAIFNGLDHADNSYAGLKSCVESMKSFSNKDDFCIQDGQCTRKIGFNIVKATGKIFCMVFFSSTKDIKGQLRVVVRVR